MTPYVPPPTPFGGFIDNEPAQTGPHLLVSGPSGVGKSRRVLVPALFQWQGPVVAVSSKPDLIELALNNRLSWGGKSRTYVLDLSGQVPDSMLPDGVHRVVMDPTTLIADDDQAIDLAGAIIKAGTAGAGTSQGDPFWETLATAPLAALLRAAGTDGIAWARDAVGNTGADDDDDTEDAEFLVPTWANAIARLTAMGSAMLAAELASAGALDAKMRDSVVITMKSALAPWWRSTVVGGEGDRAFVPAMLEHPRSTLFIVAPADGVAAGAAVGCVDAITEHWRRGQTRPAGKKLPHLLLAVDELCNTMPWAKLPIVVTEARAMGVCVLAAVQTTKQFARRYGGREGMEELQSVFPAMLLLVGADEREMLERAAWAAGRTERHKVSTDHLGKASQSSEISDVLHGADLLPKSWDQGRLLRGTRPGENPGQRTEAGLLVDLVDVSELRYEVAS